MGLWVNGFMGGWAGSCQIAENKINLELISDNYLLQRKFMKVMFLHMSVCPQGVVSQHALQVVYQYALQVSGGSPVPHPGGS